MKKLVYIFLILLTTNTNATIHLDHEKDPWPLVSLSVVIPYGSLSPDAKKQVAGSYAEDILQTGSSNLAKQEFTDQLSEFGAELSFDVGGYYSTISLEFPYLKEKNYQKLAQLIKDNLEKPRINDEEFNLAQSKLKNSIIGVLDSDEKLLYSTLQRWLKAKKFQYKPLTLDTLKGVSKSDVQNFISEMRGTKEIWVGFLGSDETLPVVQMILKAVFPQQEKIESGKYLKVLQTNLPKIKEFKKSKEFIIVDKDDRNQSIIGMYALNPDKTFLDNELKTLFTHYVISGRGIDSILGSEIRKKRGLAYFAAGMGSEYYNFPLLGLISNPQRKRQDEALQVFSMLTKELYQTGKMINDISEAEWGTLMQAFRYGHIVDNSTHRKRLNMRSSIVTDDITLDFYNSDPEKWKLSRAEVSEFLAKQWSGSTLVLGSVGNAKELKPLVSKYFPDYKITIIPYKQTVYDGVYYK